VSLGLHASPDQRMPYAELHAHSKRPESHAQVVLRRASLNFQGSGLQGSRSDEIKSRLHRNELWCVEPCDGSMIDNPEHLLLRHVHNRGWAICSILLRG
jgi:hypothetical protein